jgi:thiol-disulfide isomerase/thioredoxin
LSAVALGGDSQPAKKPVSEPAASPSIEQQLRQNPDNVALWNQYLWNGFRPLMAAVKSDPDEAQKRVDAMRKFVSSLQPTQDEPKRMLVGAKWALGSWEQGIRLARTSRAELEAALKARPDDAATLSRYVQKVRAEVLPLIYTTADRAEGSLKSAKTFLDGLRPRIKEEPAKRALEGADQHLAWLQHSIDAAKQAAKLAGTPRAELEAKLNANPDDGSSIKRYGQKLSMELGPLAARDATSAEKGLNSAKTFLDVLRAKVKDEAAKKALAGADRIVAGLQISIDRAKQRAALVGKDAAPLAVEAWVNGDPLTADDLKGKVVLLDFWAVWFGPSIAAFPHLRQWQEKYADKGLVIVGLTRYFSYQWDEKAARPIRPQGKDKVAPEKEREMLAKFAERHKLRYRFAIQKGDTLADYYVVHRIPHVVLIDRQGKIRLIRTGGDPRNVMEIQQMLEQLLANGD